MEGKSAQKLEVILTPYLGRTVAQTTIRMQCKVLGATPESLTAAQFPALVDRVAAGLQVFVGVEKARQIRAEMAAIV